VGYSSEGGQNMPSRYFQKQLIGGGEIEVDKTGKPIIERSACTHGKGMKRTIVHGNFRICLFPNGRYEIVKVVRNIPKKAKLEDLK
jgi:hypothetical protein